MKISDLTENEIENLHNTTLLQFYKQIIISIGRFTTNDGIGRFITNDDNAKLKLFDIQDLFEDEILKRMNRET